MEKVRITKIRSTIGQTERVERNMEALGLSKMNSYNEVVLTPQISGIINKVKHLVKIEKL